MPVIIRGDEVTPIQLSDGAQIRRLLSPDNTNNDHINLDLLTLQPGTSDTVELEAGAIGWIQLLDGSASITGLQEGLTPEHITYLPVGYQGQLTAGDRPARALIAIVPDAARFDANFKDNPQVIQTKTWTREPVLQSEHDARTRIYLATPKMAGTDAYRGEMITYPPGASAPEHHHEGAEHFQYMISGTATAMLAGVPHALNAGDVLYNYENERHTFVNETNENFSFVEFFVPGPCKTVWSPGANVCAWLPTGKDVEGRPPVRDIAYHVHGKDDGI